jgi:hypothetical protein
MAILTQAEKDFLDVFLYEATTSPFFSGPATKALYTIGVEYRDLSYIAWAYHQEVARCGYGWGHAAEAAPALPWPDRATVLQRNKEIQGIWGEKREGIAPVQALTSPAIPVSSESPVETPRGCPSRMPLEKHQPPPPGAETRTDGAIPGAESPAS